MSLGAGAAAWCGPGRGKVGIAGKVPKFRLPGFCGSTRSSDRLQFHFVRTHVSSCPPVQELKLSGPGFCNKRARVDVHTDIKTRLEDISTNFCDSSEEPHTRSFHMESFANTFARIFPIGRRGIGMGTEAVWMECAGVEWRWMGLEAIQMRMEPD
ncbi:hypothetical protein DUI87_35281 [Hirundo rustica rustica]|uniref:Uncharacterized protein n=1 Tax=Hirundo rustica rustica TaxID=333673 RepID=A0A3M0IPJ8_HIRRU|nr:hypothetical protein DUI87_35281 [Hirundo rustica rustica]